jgi:hypothetical protein
MANTYPSFLDDAGYPYAGVGDLSDLKLSLGVGDGGQWIGFINTGWFYTQKLEQYHYAVLGTQTANAPAGSGQATESLSYRPSWGPIILTDTASGEYTQHHNTFQPGKSVSWTAMGSGFYYTTVPASTMVSGVRDLTILPLGAVSGSGSLISDKFYWYDYPSSRIYIKPKNTSPINVFLDYVELNPLLRFREIVIQQDGVLYPSYQRIENVSIIRGYQQQTITGPCTGYLTHTLTGVANGDWVVLEYNVQKSFIIPNHQTIQYYTTLAASTVLRINYETSLPDVIPALSLTQPIAEPWNLNPLFSNAYRTGYLYHANMALPASSYWSVNQVLMDFDKDVVVGQWNEQFKALILVLDKQGLPVPHYPVTLNMTAGASAVGRWPTAAMGKTDGRGEIHFLVAVASTMSSLTCTAVSAGVSGSVTGTIINARTALPSAVFFGGTTELFVSKDMTPRRFWRVYAKSSYLDGIPKPLSMITLRSEKISAFEYKGNFTNQEIVVQGQISSQNLDCIAGLATSDQIGYLPQPGDQLEGHTFSSQSKIWRSEN